MLQRGQVCSGMNGFVVLLLFLLLCERACWFGPVCCGMRGFVVVSAVVPLLARVCCGMGRFVMV